LLRFLNSRNGRIIALLLVASWVALAIQAARIPLLTARLNHLEHTTRKLDSLQTTLTALQERYNKVHTLLGTSAAGAAPTATVAPATLQQGAISPSQTASEPSASTMDKATAAPASSVPDSTAR
jgi:biopolymer transport protein ExbB/TolQ